MVFLTTTPINDVHPWYLGYFPHPEYTHIRRHRVEIKHIHKVHAHCSDSWNMSQSSFLQRCVSWHDVILHSIPQWQRVLYAQDMRNYANLGTFSVSDLRFHSNGMLWELSNSTLDLFRHYHGIVQVSSVYIMFSNIYDSLRLNGTCTFQSKLVT